MWWYVFAGGVILLAIALVVWKIARTVVYETHLIVHNEENEFLLVYDNVLRHFKLPVGQVPFDEIPTKLTYSIMEEILPGAEFAYDPLFHAVGSKYDRIRDDVAPAYVYEEKRRIRKHCCLCYVLQMKEYTIPERLKKEAPYPEFYSVEGMESMGEDIGPSKTVLDVCRRIVSIGEREHVRN